jgi:predicted SAM-dependent methyltransferase
MKLNIGAGNNVKKEFLNHDIFPGAGIDIVHDLNIFPYPWQDNSFDEIHMINVLEHLQDTIKVMEELHRIARGKAKVIIRVPYCHAQDMFSDPTHVRFFNQYSFDFFDPTKRHCKERPYYSKARFNISRKIIYTKFFGVYREIHNEFLQSILLSVAGYIGNIVWVIEFDLEAIK